LTGFDASRVLATLQLPTASDLRAAVPDVRESLDTQLSELYARPCADRCDRLAVSMEGALRLVRAYRAALIIEGEDHGR
jgi:hypothetical protein